MDSSLLCREEDSDEGPRDTRAEELEYCFAWAAKVFEDEWAGQK